MHPVIDNTTNDPADGRRASLPRVITPRRPWLVATLVVVVVSIVGMLILTRAVNRAYQQRFDAAVDVFESIIEDQVNGFRVIGLVIPTVLSAEDAGMTVESLSEFMGSAGAGAPLVGALPLDGFAGLGFLSFAADGTPSLVLLPTDADISESDLVTPDVIDLAAEALLLGRTMTSGPLPLPGDTAYVFAVPATDETVVLEFINPSGLLTGAGTRRGARVVAAQAFDTATGVQIGSTGGIPAGDRANQTLSTKILGRAVTIDVFPGPDFDWESGWLPGIASGSLGLAIAALIYVIGVFSHRRTIEQRERLEAARKNLEDKDRFIAAVSHELRTPLTAVVGLADELTEAWDTFDRAEAHQLTEIIAQEGLEMSLLVEDLLVAARIEGSEIAVEPQAISIGEQVRLVARALGEKGQHVEVGPVDVTAWADPLRVRQIIRNLLTNALRHGGEDVRIDAVSEEGMVSIRVRDSGNPISDDARLHMFEPYYRTTVRRGPQPSVGLGLSVSHHLAGLMGGDLTYRHDNGWVVFQLDLPAPP